ncbi:substrate-binding domain-containing protein [Chromobacterium alticapitis]|uniref:PBP domain-containing protein n=1 Tax=Chromobacterium alticapitis TaxID=2073169 RepID=A0A2S5DGS9_9NEIS|nr:substrate-binding domain-containing protein [Chromobacterium alticapitis]POZ62296.1 hypothetical protein C2I19_09005 [Chromobacterium alticapitis]
MSIASLLSRPSRSLRLYALLALAVATLSTLALALRPSPAPLPLIVAGSGQLQTLLRDLAAAYGQSGGIQIEGGGSEAGLAALRRGVADLAAVSQSLPDWQDDTQTHFHLLARNSIAFIVNRSSSLRGLSQGQLQSVLTGKIVNWKALGGQDAVIRLLTRREASPTRQFVEESVLGHHNLSGLAEPLDSADEMMRAVENDPNALGYVSLQEARQSRRVVLLAVDGVPFSRATILSGRYPYVQDLYLVSLGDESAPRAAPLLAWLKTPQAQETIERHQLISVY